MIQAQIISINMLLIIPIQLPGTLTLLLGSTCAFILSFLLTFVVRACCRRLEWLDRPSERRVHSNPVPRLGGLAMFFAFVIASLLFYAPGLHSNPNEIIIYWLLLAAASLIVPVHVYDDIKGLNPLPKLFVQTIAVIIVLGPWGTTFHGILLFTFNNPFGQAITQLGRLRFSVLFVQGTPVLEIRNGRSEIMTTLSAKSGLSDRGIGEGSSDGIARSDFHRQTIAFAASFTAEPMEEVLAYWMQELALPSSAAFLIGAIIKVRPKIKQYGSTSQSLFLSPLRNAALGRFETI